MLIHSTADNSKKIQMRDYPLASFPPWEVFKNKSCNFSLQNYGVYNCTKTIIRKNWTSVSWTSAEGTSVAGTHWKLFLWHPASIFPCRLPLSNITSSPSTKEDKAETGIHSTLFFFFESPDLKSERDWRKKMLKNRQHRKLILNETCPTFAFMSSTKCSLRTRYTQRNVIYCNSDQYHKHVHPHGSFNLHLHLELVYISCKHYFSPKQAAYTFPKVSSTAQKRVEAGNKNPLLLELTLWLKNVLEWKPSVCIQTPLSDSY